MPTVSSTEVRRRLAAGEGAEQLVPRTVLEYIRARGLYGTGRSAGGAPGGRTGTAGGEGSARSRSRSGSEK